MAPISWDTAPRAKEYARCTKVEVRSTGGYVRVVRVSGDVDMDVCPDLQRCLERELERGCKNLVISFVGSEYLDSSALAVLMDTYRHIFESGGKMALVIKNANLLRLFSVTGLDRLFDVHRTEREAVQRIESPTLTYSPSRNK